MGEQTAKAPGLNRAKTYQLVLFPLNNGATNVYYVLVLSYIATFGSKVRDRARYSTLQDLDAGRHTEVDMFAGAVVRMGRELGIPAPYNEFTYHMIKALEEKNDGKFDYE